MPSDEDDSGLGKRERRRIDRLMGRHARQLKIYANSRSGVIHALILRTLSLEGPTFLVSIRADALRFAGELGIQVPSHRTTYQRGLDYLDSQGYVRSDRDPTGKNRMTYHLTCRGAVAALAMPNVRTYLTDFLNHHNDTGNPLLPGLQLVGLFIKDGVGNKYWDHFLSEVSGRVIRTLDLDKEQKNCQQNWTYNLALEFTTLTHLIENGRKGDQQTIEKLTKLGWSTQTLDTMRKKLESPQYREELRRILISGREAGKQITGAVSNVFDTWLKSLN